MEGLKTKSIKTKLIKDFFIVILSTVVFLNIVLINFVKKYYYDNTEELLLNQIQVSASFYNKYFSTRSLAENVYDNIDAFWNQNNAQVEIFDENKKLIMDSIGVIDENLLKAPDIQKAFKGEIGRWVGKVDYSKSNVMAVSYPLTNGKEVVGVIRFITSLEAVNSIIRSIMIFFLTISVIVLVIGVILSILIANSLITPIKSLTRIAEKMASGNFNERNKVEGDNEISKLAATFNFMADEIEKREQLKNEFISSVSHELRTPLTSIKGWAITLNSHETDKETLEMGFEIIEAEVDRLTGMVEELLDFSRLVNDKMSLNMEEVSVMDFLCHIESLMKPRAIKEHKNLTLIYDKEIGEAYIDVNRIKQVLINLLDNSFKFTTKDGNIILKAIKTNSIIRFTVEDDGCGITIEDLPRVKEKFFKGKTSKSKNGIGLSICDEIIKLHNGKFDIYSEFGIGTRIDVSIPLVRETY
ncbi:ATP-binding protein [Clostridium carnis]